MRRCHLLLAVPVLWLAPLAAQAPPAERTLTEAIASGIAWLVAHQDEDGGFSAAQFVRHDGKDDLCTGTGKPDQDLYVTGMATMALLARGNSERNGPQREVVAKALAWIDRQAGADGFYGAPTAANAVSAHALACLVCGEARAVDAEPVPPRSLQRLRSLRLADGTWPARPGDRQGEVEATYWAALALSSLSGAAADKPDLAPAWQVLEQARGTSGPAPAVEAMLRWLGHRQPKSDARLTDLLAALDRARPQWRTGPEAVQMDFLAWQFGSYAVFQAGGTAFEEWQAALQQALVPNQCSRGAAAGSWDPVDARGKQGGRVYATAANLVSLELAQRRARIVQKAR